jgi:hypothetical protein
MTRVSATVALERSSSCSRRCRAPDACLRKFTRA